MTVQLVDILREEAAIPTEEIDRALRQQQAHGGALAEWLVRRGAIGEEDLFFLLSRRLGAAAIPEERLAHLTVSPELRRRVPRQVAIDCVLLPLDLDHMLGTLSVAMIDPSDPNVLALLRTTSRVAQIRPYLARRPAIVGNLERIYAGDVGDAGDAPPLPPLNGINEKRSVEVISGKVEIDADLAQEIAVLGDTDELPDSATVGGDLETTSVVTLKASPSGRLDAVGASAPTPRPPAPTAQPVDGVEAEPTGELELEVVVEEVAAAAAETPEPDQDAIPEPAMFETPPPELDWDGDEVATAVVPARSVLGDSAQVAIVSELPSEIAGLLGELMASVGVLVAMLEERVDPGGATSREYARLCRLVARELGLDGMTVDRITVGGHLFGLDIALRREVGSPRCADAREVFSVKPTRPGGLNPTLRSLGACAVGVFEETEAAEPLGVAVIRVVSDYLDLRAESEEESTETVVQLLRASGTDPALIEALVRVVEEEETLVETRRSKLTDRR